MDEGSTLYDRIGGEAGVAALVDDFYERVLSDTELAPFFERVPVDKLMRMQREFFAAALDGPGRYSGLALSHAHQGRGIAPRHLGRFVDHLLETLRARGVGDADAAAIIGRINTYADQVTGGVTDAE